MDGADVRLLFSMAEGHFPLFVHQAQKTPCTESKYSTTVAIAQISSERKMIELGTIMDPFCK